MSVSWFTTAETVSLVSQRLQWRRQQANSSCLIDILTHVCGHTCLLSSNQEVTLIDWPGKINHRPITICLFNLCHMNWSVLRVSLKIKFHGKIPFFCMVDIAYNQTWSIFKRELHAARFDSQLAELFFPPSSLTA